MFHHPIGDPSVSVIFIYLLYESVFWIILPTFIEPQFCFVDELNPSQ